MTLQIEKYYRKPFQIDAVFVTEENMVEVAEWAKGELVVPENGAQRFIKIDVSHPLHERQKQAYVGDWVLSAGTGFRVYPVASFERSFAPLDETGLIAVAPLEEVTQP